MNPERPSKAVCDVSQLKFSTFTRCVSRSLILTLLVLMAQSLSQHAVAQRHSVTSGFRGSWEWAIYARSSRDLPPAYRDMSVQDVPERFLGVTLYRRGNRLTGLVESGERFLAKVELDVRFRTIIRGNVAQLTLESGHGGTITATMTLRRNALYWRIIWEQGEHYFPREAILHRVR